MACERHVGFQPAGSRPVSPNEGRLCPLADGAGECEARASSNAGEEIEEEAAEIPAVRPQAVPAGPSEKERLEHLPLHEPYRSWCATCVAGRAVSDRHIWQPPRRGHWQSLDWIMVTWRREVSLKNDAPQSCLERTVGTSGFMRSPCRVKESLSHGALRLLHRVFPELDLDDSVFGATQSRQLWLSSGLLVIY